MQRLPPFTYSVLSIAFATAFVACGGTEEASPFASTEVLGEALFHDTNLSMNRTQSCATCHDPQHAFIDPRLDETGRIAAFSLGDDGSSLGGRNAPTAAYAAFSPSFAIGTRQRFNRHSSHRTYEGPLGGMFLDGRAADLQAQAGGPPLNPIEMGMPDASAVVDRIRENPTYVRAFEDLYGADVLASSERAYDAMTNAIASFERTRAFAPFDAKYDRFLRGEATLSFKELNGKALFFSEFASCSICHQLHASGDPVNKFQETFTGYEYHNVGTPALPGAATDLGLALHPDVTDSNARGLFKVPTLRNVAVTEPYMHNGVFRDLKTVVAFYDQFVNETRTTNLETGQPWRDAAVPETVSLPLLRAARPMKDHEVDAMVCFLRTLTDARYEHLVDQKGIDCAD